LAGARVIIEAASKHAESLKIRENIVVVDGGGQLISLDRTEGARPGSVATAITKAMSAAAFRQPTGPVPQGAANPDLRLDVGLQLAAQAGGEKFTTLEGGVPIIVDGQVIGAVGVGGATGAQDAEVARAGIVAFLHLLETRPEKSTPAPAP
jgi:glc operon protein GlcG